MNAVIHVTVEGVGTGLLCSSPEGFVEAEAEAAARGGRPGPKKKRPTHAEAAEAAAYRLGGKRSALGFPCVAFHRSTMEGGKGQTIQVGGRGRPVSVQTVLAGVWEVEPKDLIAVTRRGKPIKTYRVDVRTGKNRMMKPAARIVLARPLIETPWEVSFDVLWDNEGAAAEVPDLIRGCMERAGRQVGVGAFRPLIDGKATGGWFGKYRVVSFEPA